jgi:hypothetical protein
MDEGIIAERGKHEELLSREGLYAKMWRTYTQSRQWVLQSKSAGEGTASPPADREFSEALPGETHADDNVFPEVSPAV